MTVGGTNAGQEMYRLAQRLFPICRSITGPGVRETLGILREHIPLNTHEVPSGTRVFDWTVPREWEIREAYIQDPDGCKVVDFRDHNLHVMGYSVAVDKTVSLEELQEHLYSDEQLPDAIPYVTSYYQERWGFCLSHRQRQRLKPGRYRVFIDSELKDGHLTYGEVVIPGKIPEEIFLSTYICHPSMANNEVSGPVVTTFLVKWILEQPRRYTYRIVFVPETIGSITYLARNLPTMKKRVQAGFNVTCVGDDRAYSYLPSREGDTLADRVALNVLRFMRPEFTRYSFLDRGSDERQYCWPGVDLPVVSVMRSKYGAYPEYHTSLDNLDLISPEGLAGAYAVLRRCLEVLEDNSVYQVRTLGEPQLGRYGLYPTVSNGRFLEQTNVMRNFLAHADGTCDVVAISDRIGVPVWDLCPVIQRLKEVGLLREVLS